MHVGTFEPERRTGERGVKQPKFLLSWGIGEINNISRLPNYLCG